MIIFAEDNQRPSPTSPTTNATPASVERYLKGVSFPADKNDLMRQIRVNGAPQDILETIEQFSEKTYHSPIDVSKEYGQLKE